MKGKGADVLEVIQSIESLKKLFKAIIHYSEIKCFDHIDKNPFSSIIVLSNISCTRIQFALLMQCRELN